MCCKQLSFPHTRKSVFIVNLMLFGRWCRFLHYIFFCQEYARNIALLTMACDNAWWLLFLHIEHSISVFQRETLLRPFPHIDLSWVLSLALCSCTSGARLICLSSRDKILPISLYLEHQSPYYFWKVVWSLSLDYSILSPVSYALHILSSFKCVLSPGMEYGNAY